MTRLSQYKDIKKPSCKGQVVSIYQTNAEDEKKQHLTDMRVFTTYLINYLGSRCR